MPRSKRYHIPHSLYHVMLRGNAKQDIFFSENDRYTMSTLLQDGLEKYDHSIHAFCFMNNHIHLLVQVDEEPLSKIIHNLAFRYTQKLNRQNKRTGHLFQGRFKAILIQELPYFKRVLRYIHNNPVRAGIVKTAEQYFWSSHRGYLDHAQIPWLTVDYGLSQFGENKKKAKAVYSLFMLQHESQEELDELRASFKNGPESDGKPFSNGLEIKNRIDEQSFSPSLTNILQATSQILQIEEKAIISQKSRKASFARGIITTIAKATKKIAIKEIASLFTLHESSVSSLYTRFYEKYKTSTETQELLEQISTEARKIAIADCKA